MVERGDTKQTIFEVVEFLQLEEIDTKFVNRPKESN